jgi:calcineurin-like phosphoesterase family protein
MWWLERLTGKIVYIQGSHDRGIDGRAKDYEWLEVGGYHLLALHNPLHIPLNWDGWTIHGHTHSTRFVDRQRKRVCVGVEATGYKPITLSKVVEAIREGVC